MIAGFTGSSGGINSHQCEELERRLIEMGATIMHHGLRPSGDLSAHKIAKKLDLYVVGHPPFHKTKAKEIEAQKILVECDEVRIRKPFLVRSRDIVDECEFMFIGPWRSEYVRNGEWATKRYAEKVGRNFHILDWL